MADRQLDEEGARLISYIRKFNAIAGPRFIKKDQRTELRTVVDEITHLLKNMNSKRFDRNDYGWVKWACINVDIKGLKTNAMRHENVNTSVVQLEADCMSIYWRLRDEQRRLL